MFEGYVCEKDRSRIEGENVIHIIEVGKGEPEPATDAPEECIYCGKKTNDIFVSLEDF